MENYSRVCFFLCWLKFFQFICDCFHAFLKSQTVAGISTNKVDRSILKLHGLLALLHSCRRKEIKLCLFWLHDRKAFQSLGILVNQSMALIEKASYMSVMKSTSSTLGSWSTILSASSQNVVGRANGARNSAQPSMMYVMSLIWLDNMMTVILQSICITWDLSVFIGVLSLVASGHGTGTKG